MELLGRQEFLGLMNIFIILSTPLVDDIYQNTARAYGTLKELGHQMNFFKAFII